MDEKAILAEHERMLAEMNETTPSLEIPDFENDPLPTCEDLRAAGFTYSGRRSDGNRRQRDAFVDLFGYAVPCREAIAECVARSPILEVGAGVAFWASLIARAGGDVVATDLHPRPVRPGRILPGSAWHPVEGMDAAEATRRHPDRSVLMIWPSLGDRWAADVLDAMAPGQVLIHVGEIGQATGDERFARTVGGPGFEVLSRVSIPTWPGMDDDMTVFRKRG